MTDDPMDEIELSRAQHGLGVSALRIYRGARDEGASRQEAFIVLVGWFRAMMIQNESEDE